MIAKPRPRLLDKRDQRAKVAEIDRKENAKVKQRSGGRCEVRIDLTLEGYTEPWAIDRRCVRRASQTHHLISGIGRRNIGKSILAEHKLHVCDLHHQEIHGHVLRPLNATERESAATVRYERCR